MDKRPERNNPYRDYAKYSGMAIEMFVLIFLGIFGGTRLDARLEWEIPIFTVVLPLLGLGIAFYRIFKDLK